MLKIQKNRQTITIDVTDAQLSGNAGLTFVASMAAHLQVPELLSSSLQIKRRRRGCSDSEMLMGLIYSLACGNGALHDLESFRRDTATLTLAGMERAPGSRRLGEYLAQFQASDIEALTGVVRNVTAQLLPGVCQQEIARRGYVPVFIDGSEIEVTGRYYEEAKKGYSGAVQYWLHGIFVGGLWASGRLCPGGIDVVADWREQLESDVLPVLKDLDTQWRADHPVEDGKEEDAGLPVWISVDNAYYRKECVEYFTAQHWDYSISVTNGTYKRPILRRAKQLPEAAWKAINHHEDAVLVTHEPSEWQQEQSYVVIRTQWDGLQRLAFPRYTVICVSDAALPLKELIARHRHKQGMENEFKGPLDALDLHHPPCLRFLANQAFYLCGQLAHTLLRAVQYQLLPDSEKNRSIRTLIHDLIRTVAQVVHSGRRCIARFAKTTYRLDWIHHAACQLE